MLNREIVEYVVINVALEVGRVPVAQAGIRRTAKANIGRAPVRVLVRGDAGELARERRGIGEAAQQRR